MGRSLNGDGVLQACRALHAAVDRFDHAAAVRLGVSRNDLRALTLLEGESLTAGRLAGALQLTSGSVTALLDRLEKRGLVRRVADPEDRRAVIIEPSATMFRQTGPLQRAVEDAVARMAEDYEVEERLAVIRHLDDARQAFAKATEALTGGRR